MQKALYDRFSGRLYMLCRRYSFNDAMAQEALSDGFLSIFEQIGNYRGEGSFEGWMRTIVVRSAIRRFKQEQSRMDRYSNDEGPEPPFSDRDHDERMDVQKALLCAMRRLSDSERSIFNLVAVEGYKFEDAASLLEENISTLKSRYYKALQKMKNWLQGYLGEDYLERFL